MAKKQVEAAAPRMAQAARQARRPDGASAALASGRSPGQTALSAGVVPTRDG